MDFLRLSKIIWNCQFCLTADRDRFSKILKTVRNSEFSFFWSIQIVLGIKPFKCKVCGKCFAWKRDLLVHEKLHEGFTSFRCGECGDQFNRFVFLIRHLKEKHDEIGPFICCKCGKSFDRRLQVTMHFKRQHWNYLDIFLVILWSRLLDSELL